MSRSGKPPLRVYVLLIFGSLLVLGLAEAAWSFRLQILGTVNTSQAAASFIAAFTDDDGRVDDGAGDPGDAGDCPVGGRPDSSCDPVGPGPGPVERQGQDVARCAAQVETDARRATVVLDAAYPGYFCTAWFGVLNSGSLPLRISDLRLNESPLVAGAWTRTDLNLGGEADLALRLSGFEPCQQLDPGQQLSLQLSQEILAAVPPDATLSFEVQVVFQQWNAPCLADASGAAPDAPSP